MQKIPTWEINTTCIDTVHEEYTVKKTKDMVHELGIDIMHGWGITVPEEDKGAIREDKDDDGRHHSGVISRQKPVAKGQSVWCHFEHLLR